jgi:crossover junction endodeoxyribonuclease RusA
LLTGPCRLVVVFYFPRPKSHYGARGLKPSAPGWVTRTPDLDKLVRAVGDSLTGVCVRDDSLIVELVAMKRYADGEPARALVRLELLEATAAHAA